MPLHQLRAYRSFMDNPKQVYPRSEARQLRDTPCPHCGKQGAVTWQDTLTLGDASLDPDVMVMWRCGNELCRGSNGFWIEGK